MSANRPNRLSSSQRPEQLEPRLLLAAISFEPLVKYPAGPADPATGPRVTAMDTSTETNRDSERSLT